MFRINLKQLFILMFVALVAVSCDNSPASPDDNHIDVDGLAIELNGVEVYKEFEGVITNNMILNVSDTLHLTVHFLDHEGNEIEHEDGEEEEEEELEFDITDSNIIAITMDDHDDDHHELEFELVGLSAGTTTFSLSLMHDGHADYNSLAISVTVN